MEMAGWDKMNEELFGKEKLKANTNNTNALLCIWRLVHCYRTSFCQDTGPIIVL